MTPINLDKLERIARSASKKWSSQVWCGEASPQWTAIGPVHGQKESEWELDPDSSAGRKAETDSKFIGRFSPSVCLSLIAEVRRLREALAKIADPRKRDHKEPDAYTELGCVMSIATQALEDSK